MCPRDGLTMNLIKRLRRHSHINPTDPELKYSIRDHVLGVGTFSKVVRAVDDLTGDSVAIKIVDKKIDVKTELDIMRSLNHPNILKVIHMYTNEQCSFIVLEYGPYGDLFDYVVGKDGLPENVSRQIIRQLSSGVAYMHNQGIIHRDLKPENILLVTAITEDIPIIKITDFGLSSADKPPFFECCGSREYVAPEILLYLLSPGSETLTKGYDNKVDCWAIGIITYIVMTGLFPFYSKDIRALNKQILRGNYKLDMNISNLSKGFIRSLLVKDPDLRPTASDLPRSMWLSKKDVI